MLWFLVAIFEPLTHGFANIIDNYFVNRLFKHPATLVFYSAFANVFFLPLVWFIAMPELPSARLVPFFALVGIIDIAYLYPYYKALQDDDTSIVADLFEMGKIFVPILAFLFVGERLAPLQYAGFAVIVASSVLLTVHRTRRTFKLNSSFFYMLLCSFLLSVEVVVYKYIFTEVNWSTGFTWGTIFSALGALSILAVKRYRRDIAAQCSRFRHAFPIFMFEEFLTFAGSAASTYAIALVPVTLVESVSSLQPFFVLLYAILFKKYFPKLFKEHVDRNHIIKKAALFICMLIGIILVTIHGA